ncbi:MAG: hypothetical protein ABSG32_11510 [Terriglobia bacterium]
MVRFEKTPSLSTSRREFLITATAVAAPAVTGWAKEQGIIDSEPWPRNNDPSARTWLPVAGAATPSVANSFLESIHGQMRILGCWYEGNQLRASRPFLDGKLNAGQSTWACEVHASAAESNALDLQVKFKLASGTAKSAGVAVAFDFTLWTLDNYVFVPGQLYGGNRFRILPLHYPPYIHDASQRPLDMPVTTTNILHLNPDGARGKVEMTTGNVPTPMLGFFHPAEQRGFLVLAEQRTRFGNNGLFFEEDAGPSATPKRISFVVSAPGVREQRYVMCGRADSWDRGADWNAGDELTLNFKLYNFAADDLQAFFAKVFDVRKALTGQNHYACVTPYSAAADLIAEHHNAHKWFEGKHYSFYCNQPYSPNPYAYQIGWGGIPILSFPQALLETPERLRRVSLTLDTVMAAQAQTGLIYCINRDGEIMGDAHGRQAERPTITMTRRAMDVLYFGLKTLDALKKRGHEDLIKPAWETGLRACAEALIKVWKQYGQFGQFINADTLEMDINGSTAGCAAGAGLALASAYFHDARYLELAEAATRMYYTRDFLKGYAGGGASEILQAPDSEAPWDMVESCMVLYETTGEREWVEKGEFAAHLLSTWMVSHDYVFPPGSAMQQAGTHAAGSIFASSQNNHSAPGFYILSGDCLLKLFRATGDQRYAEMYKDTSHNVIQYVGAPHNPLRHESGFVTERVQLSDWEGKNAGFVDYKDSNMAWEVLAALTCLENPGIYLHTDDDTFLVLDHVEATVLKRDATGVTIHVTNPTPYSARVAVFGESAAQAKQPLGHSAYLAWPRIEVAAGETGAWHVDASGQLRPTADGA